MQIAWQTHQSISSCTPAQVLVCEGELAEIKEDAEQGKGMPYNVQLKLEDDLLFKFGSLSLVWTLVEEVTQLEHSFAEKSPSPWSSVKVRRK